MEKTRLSDKKNLFILAIIVIFALFGLWLRFLPMPQLLDGPIQKLIFMDTWYNMRMIEQITANFPNTPWFDPMNGYPTGKEIDWGPLFPLFCSVVCIIAGATTRPAMMMVSSWIPPLLSLVMIPLMYGIGTYVWNRKVGIVSALLISVISGEYMYRSLFGYIDHHILETLLSTAFLAAYIFMLYALSRENSIPSKASIGSAIAAGLLYFLGIMNIPTMVLFAMIIALFILIHAIIVRDEENLKALAIHQGIIFGLFIILFAVFGIHQSGWSLIQYTPSHIILAAILILEPVLLYGISKYLKDRPSWQYAGGIVGIGIICYALLSLCLPTITAHLADAFTSFFFASYTQTYINEMQMWSLDRAFHSFNVAILLLPIGMAICGYQIWKKYNPLQLLTLLWGLIILISTILHLRYEYYIAVNVVLFASFAIIMIADLLPPHFGKKTVQKGKKVQEAEQAFGITPGILLSAVVILVITAMSANMTWIVTTEQLKLVSMDNDWAGALVWLPQNSPDPGVDYLKLYDKAGFTYPNQSYGVISWWDYGHWIEFISKRMPVTTPFQNNVEPVARFFISTNESLGDGYAKEVGAKYIITDYPTATTKFAALPLWAAGSGQNTISTYQKTYYQKSTADSNRYDPVITLEDPYFDTMIARLQLFDGSATSGVGGNLVDYADNTVGGQTIPIVSKTTSVNAQDAAQILAKGEPKGEDLVSLGYTSPVKNVSALTHYRLIYESPTSVAKDKTREIKSVKIFERVGGHVIPGEGTIELPLVTNQGRTFTYRQNSVNGQFVLPYSTTGNPYEVKATGPYIIVGSGQTIDVSEEEIQ